MVPTKDNALSQEALLSQMYQTIAACNGTMHNGLEIVNNEHSNRNSLQQLNPVLPVPISNFAGLISSSSPLSQNPTFPMNYLSSYATNTEASPCGKIDPDPSMNFNSKMQSEVDSKKDISTKEKMKDSSKKLQLEIETHVKNRKKRTENTTDFPSEKRKKGKSETDSSSTSTLENGKALSGRWTSTEHRKFLEGLKKYGKDWRNIAKYIGTRNYIQTRTHAQKYFKKVAKARKGSGKDVPFELMSTANNGQKWHYAEDGNADLKKKDEVTESKTAKSSACLATKPDVNFSSLFPITNLYPYGMSLAQMNVLFGLGGLNQGGTQQMSSNFPFFGGDGIMPISAKSIQASK